MPAAGHGLKPKAEYSAHAFDPGTHNSQSFVSAASEFNTEFKKQQDTFIMDASKMDLSKLSSLLEAAYYAQVFEPDSTDYEDLQRQYASLEQGKKDFDEETAARSSTY